MLYMDKKEKSPLNFTLFIIFAFVAICSVIGYGFWIWYGFEKPPKSAAEFGDMFGAANALFSALAFAGVVYAMLMQQQELRFQFEELQESRKAMQSAADAHRMTVELERLNATPLLKCIELSVKKRKDNSVQCKVTIRNCGGVAIEPHLSTIEGNCLHRLDYGPLIPKDECHSFDFIVRDLTGSKTSHMMLVLEYYDRLERHFKQKISIRLSDSSFLSTAKPEEVEPEDRVY